MSNFTNPYQIEVDSLKEELLEGLGLSREIVYPIIITDDDFLKMLVKEHQSLSIRVREMFCSGEGPSDSLRIAWFAHEQLIKEISKGG